MKNCIYCQEEIADNATFCKTCEHYQDIWKNWIPHIGGGIAILTLLGSLATITIKPFRDFYNKLTWKDNIQLVNYSSNEGFTVKNVGDGDVFLQAIYFQSEYHRSSKPINISVEKANFKHHKWEGNIKSGNVITKGINLDPKTTEPIYVSENHYSYKLLKSTLKDQLLTFECETKLEYYSLNQDTVEEVTLPCIGFYFDVSSTQKDGY